MLAVKVLTSDLALARSAMQGSQNSCHTKIFSGCFLTPLRFAVYDRFGFSLDVLLWQNMKVFKNQICFLLQRKPGSSLQLKYRSTRVMERSEAHNLQSLRVCVYPEVIYDYHICFIFQQEQNRILVLTARSLYVISQVYISVMTS